MNLQTLSTEILQSNSLAVDIYMTRPGEKTKPAWRSSNYLNKEGATPEELVSLLETALQHYKPGTYYAKLRKNAQSPQTEELKPFTIEGSEEHLQPGIYGPAMGYMTPDQVQAKINEALTRQKQDLAREAEISALKIEIQEVRAEATKGSQFGNQIGSVLYGLVTKIAQAYESEIPGLGKLAESEPSRGRKSRPVAYPNDVAPLPEGYEYYENEEGEPSQKEIIREVNQGVGVLSEKVGEDTGRLITNLASLEPGQLEKLAAMNPGDLQTLASML